MEEEWARVSGKHTLPASWLHTQCSTHNRSKCYQRRCSVPCLCVWPRPVAKTCVCVRVCACVTFPSKVAMMSSATVSAFALRRL